MPALMISLLAVLLTIVAACIALRETQTPATANGRDWMNQVRAHLRRGDLANAAALYQQRTGCTHEDARRDVESMVGGR